MTLRPAAGGGTAALEWVKSSYSSNEGPECVEVAATPGTVHVRDSKNKPGPQLAVTASTWAAFVTYAATR
ncbi:DUF397 domain-containing protein [Streptomyces albus subsp. chlorinus]|uniref:DUF397 domain-containing protein n=1 Tax=Streptomyces albus TaxID=1888 RepID=UPI00156F546A|nr:DUF397 domain-containing protein [Streptomyces albus]NSC23346.1 DUF397 domain-containing protein [Streptomyces albus subsp. chlorinus]